MSLIPFSTSPTAEDINLFFKALHAWKEGTYEFDENDTLELVSIGVEQILKFYRLDHGELRKKSKRLMITSEIMQHTFQKRPLPN